MVKEEVIYRIENAILSLVQSNMISPYEEGENRNENIVKEFATIIPFDEPSQKQLVNQLEQLPTNEEKADFLISLAQDLYEKREEQMGSEIMRLIEQKIFLDIIDYLWMDHLDAIDNLRQGIGLRGYAQRDPLVEYKNEAFRMFEQLMNAIDDAIVHRIYKIQVVQPSTNLHSHTINTNTPQSEISSDSKDAKFSSGNTNQQLNKKNKLGRNDPCWCGSGKKFKKCHYPTLG